MIVPNAFGANGTPSYIDFDGATPGFGTPGGTISETATIWSTASAGNVATTARPTSTQMTIGASASDFAGQTFSINIDGGGNLNGILFNSTTAKVTLTGSANTHFNAAGIVVTVPTGSSLTWNVTRSNSGNIGLNMNFKDLTFSGGGTNIFITHMGCNDNAPITLSGSTLNLAYTASANSTPANPFSGPFTITSGTLNFQTASSSDAFSLMTTGSSSTNFNINGGTIDNTSGSAMTLSVGGNGYKIGGNFTFGGTANLSLGTNVVALTGTRTVTVNSNTLTIPGIISGSGFGITKAGSGTLALSGVNTYSGATTVNAGEVLGITGGSSTSSAMTVNSGATNGVQVVALNGQWTVSALTYNSGSFVDFNFGSTPAGTSAPIVVNSLTFSATPGIVIKSASIISPGTYPLIKYTSVSGTTPTTVSAFPPSPNAPYVGYVSNDVVTSTIYLVITSGPAGMIWAGSSGSSWDFSTANWTVGGSPTTYSDGNALTFDDTASTGTVTLQQNVVPTSITVSNASRTYTFGDNGFGFSIGGTSTLTKQGVGTLILDNFGGITSSGNITISGGVLQVGNADSSGNLGTGTVVNNSALVFNRNDTGLNVSNVISGAGNLTNNNGTVTLSGANTFTGPVVVTAGTLKVNNNSGLGATNNGTFVANGAGLDLNARNIGQEQVTVSGTGPDGGANNGALFNGSGVNTPGNIGIARVILTGDTTIGGNARWDLRSATGNDANGASLSTGGNAYSLTKAGNAQVSLTDVTVDNNLADIDVKSSFLSIEQATTGLGNPARTLTIRSGAALQFFRPTNQMNKRITLESGSYITNNSGNNTVVGPITLTNGNVTMFAATNTSLTLSNVLAGIGGLNKTGVGTLVVAGTDNHSGGIGVDDGTFILNAINNSGSALVENTSQSGSPLPVVVGGNGTNSGPVTINDTIHPGAAGKPGTIGTGNLLVFFTGKAVFDLGSVTNAGNGFNDLLVVNGSLDGSFTAPIVINPLSALATNGVYTLAQVSGTVNSQFLPPSNIGRYSFSVNYPPNLVTLSVSGGPALLKWNNAAANNLWDVQSSQNWANTSTAANDTFYNFDFVLFDDSIGSGNFFVTNNSTASPQTLTNTSSAANYTITGTGRISGSTGLTKNGTSTLTLQTTNDFTGAVVVNGGTVIVHNGSAGNSSLGSIAGGSVTVNSGGTIDFGGSGTNNSIGFTNSAGQTKQFFIAGSGVGGNGALVNNGTFAQQNVLQSLTLNADAAVGGTTRWDLRGNTAIPIIPFINLNGHTLTKVGANQISLVNVIVTNGGSIVINGGTMSFEGSSVVSNGTMVVNSGGALGHFRTQGGAITRAITLNGGTITNLSTSGGHSTNNANIAVTADSLVSFATGSDLYLNGVISGSFGFTKAGSGNLILNGVNTYSGSTTINVGTMLVPSSASIAASTNVTIGSGATLTLSSSAGLSGAITVTDNGELDVSGASGATLNINSNRTLAGTGHLTGFLNINNGGALAPAGKGAVGTFTSGSSVTLRGTTYMDVNNNFTSVDHVTCGSVNYGGTLVISNLDLAHPFTTNTVLGLFGAGVYSGAFTNIIPATPGAGMVWDSHLTVDGTMHVLPAPTGSPKFTSISVSGTSLHIVATNGATSGQFILMTTTNLNLPFSQWTPVFTNAFDGSGNLNLTTNVAVPGALQRYYLIKQ